MRSTVTIREATDDELRRLRSECPSITPTVIGIVIGFFVGGGLGSLAGFELAMCMVCGAAWVIACIIFSRDTFTMHRDRRRDLTERRVEVIEINDAEPFEVETDNPDQAPTFGFELSDGRTLLLVGEWLPEDFPSNAFCLTRFPATDMVITFATSGTNVAPTAKPTRAIQVPGTRHSYLLDSVPDRHS